MSQEKIFLEVEADAWFRRNPSSMVAANPDDPVLAALAAFDLPNRGAMLDVGGASGRIAAGFVRDHLGWSVRVVEPSGAAIAAGRQAFPQVEFRKGSITQVLPAGPHDSQYNVIVVSFVFCFLERDLLSSAISNTDSALADGGYLVIADFDSPHPRANPYAHHPGLFTYKQDYPICFLALGIYHLEYRRSFVTGSAFNQGDPYDRFGMTAVLKKDLSGRYGNLAR